MECLAAVFGGRGPYDLILSAGLTVLGSPPAEAVLAASGGSPVLFESRTALGFAWRLVYTRGGLARSAVLRREQLVFRSKDWPGMERLAKAVASGAGLITFVDSGVRLVLLICGENNWLETGKGPSVFRGLPADVPADAMRAAVGASWAALNPAHDPYLKQKIKNGGLGKIERVQNRAGTFGPTLGRLVEQGGQFRDGIAPPVALIHVNNFHSRRPETVPYTSAAFGDTTHRVRRTVQWACGDRCDSSTAGTHPWRAAVYEIET